MTAKAKPVAEPMAESAGNSIAGLLGDWIRQGTEGFVATQKILLDLAAQQNALALTMLRERMGFSLPASKNLADFAGLSIRNLMEVQRQVLDVAARQSSILTEGLRPGIANTPIEWLVEVADQGLENFISAHKQFLDIIQEQAEGAVKDFGQGKSFDTSRLAELARDASRNFLESQKKLLEILEEQLTAKKTAKHAREAYGRVDAFEMAKKSVDAFIGVEKTLMDLASSQVQANVKFAQELLTTEASRTSMSDAVKKSVSSFVAAQKALVDLAAKPRGSQEPGEATGRATAA